jgi:DnaA family protein
VVFLYGASGVGKTHLLQALCVRASEQQQAASYLPLRELHGYGPELLQGTEQMALVCLDDVSAVLQQPLWNRALFNLHRDLEERGGKLLLADEQAPAALPIILPDLASRILAGTVLRLQPLDDAAQIEALQLHALQRGLILPDDVVSYLLRRLPRDMHTLCGFLDELDLASLTAQRKLTVPFVRQVLSDRFPER